jgi:4-hydroxybenzoate polyprenyltransferase
VGVAGRVRALVRAGHPGPSLAISALIAVLAAQAARHGAGPVGLVVPAVVAGQFSIGWSNDFFDAGRDATAAAATSRSSPAGSAAARWAPPG